MADNNQLLIRISVENTQANNALVKTQNELAKTGDAAKEADGKMRAFADKVDSAGRQARIGVRSVGELSDMIGQRGLTASLYQAANAADAIGDITGALGAVNPILFALTVVGAGVAFAFNKIQEEEKKLAAETAAVKKPFEDLRQEIAALAELKGVDKFAKELGVSRDALVQYANATPQSAARLNQLINTQEKVALKSKELADAQKKLAELEKMRPYRAARFIEPEILKQRQEVERLSAEWLRLSEDGGQAQTNIRDAVIGTTQEMMPVRMTYFQMEHEGWMDAIQQAQLYKQTLADLEKAGAGIFGQMSGIVKSVVGTKTQVTQAQLDAAKSGDYKAVADEYRRRLEDVVKNGVKPGQYGAEFDAWVKGLNMDLKDALAGMEDFSLFSDPAQLKLFGDKGGEQPMIDAIQRQLKGAIGQESLYRDVFKKAFDALPTAMKKQLDEMGKGDFESFMKQYIGLDIAPDKNLMKNVASLRKDIEEALGGEITLKISADGGGGGGGASKSGSSSGGGVAKTQNVEMYAEGGYKSVKESGFIWIDKGENFWASGTRNQVPPPGGNTSITVVGNGTTALERQRLARDVARAMKRGR